MGFFDNVFFFWLILESILFPMLLLSCAIELKVSYLDDCKPWLGMIYRYCSMFFYIPCLLRLQWMVILSCSGLWQLRPGEIHYFKWTNFLFKWTDFLFKWTNLILCDLVWFFCYGIKSSIVGYMWSWDDKTIGNAPVKILWSLVTYFLSWNLYANNALQSNHRFHPLVDKHSFAFLKY